MKPLRVAVVGATGIAGQQALAALDRHPWFRVTTLAASSRSAGKAYAEAIRSPNGARLWWCREEPAPEILALPVVEAATLDPGSVDLIFSCIETDAARELEPRFARATPTLSSASAFRHEVDTPIVVPGVNLAAHAPIVEHQRKRRGWKGFVIPQSNVRDLQLSLEVVQAVREGKFHIYAVSHVSQGLEILTGVAYSEILSKARANLAEMGKAQTKKN